MKLVTRFLQLAIATAISVSSSFALAADKVLIVVTSHQQLGNTGEKTGYWLGEVTHPYKELIDAGFAVEIASIQGGTAPVDKRSLEEPDSVNQWFMADQTHRQKLQQTRKLADEKVADYRAVVFAGGHGTMWDFPDNQVLQQFAAELYQQNGVVAAVCHGPAALLNIQLPNGRSLIAGKKVTGFTNSEEQLVKLTEVMPYSLEDQLKQRGAIFQAAADWQTNVVVDGRLITGQNPQSAADVGKALVKALQQ